MNQPSSEDQLRPYYNGFDTDHDRLRNELLSLLPAKELSEKTIAAPNHSNGVKPTRLTFPRLAIATLLFVAVSLSALHRWGPTQPVYGMEHLAKRLLTIRSLHLKGWMYETITTEDGVERVEKFPVERYVRRPDCIGFIAYGFSIPGGGKPSHVNSGYTASNGKQSIHVSHNDKTAVITAMPEDPFHVELFVESQIQASVASQFMQGPPEEYRKLRSEKIDDVLCDLYLFDSQNPQSDPRSSRQKHLVWLNPGTGIPAKVESYVIDNDGNEMLKMSEAVQVNVEPPTSLFSFRAPDGYEETVIDTKKSTVNTQVNPKLFSIGSGGSDAIWLATWHSLNIDDRAVLICWSQDDRDQSEKKWFARQPKFELYLGNHSRPCREQTLSTNKIDDTQWRWSLIFPDDNDPIGEYLLRFSVKNKKSIASQVLKPLRFPRERLQEFIAEAQRRSLPDSTKNELFTLEQIELKL